MRYHKKLNYKRIPFPTIFCRAPVFVVSSSPSDVKLRKDCVDKTKCIRYAKYSNNSYTIEVSGAFIDHHIDLPLFMILIQEAINTLNKKSKTLPNDLQIPLKRIDILLTNPRKTKNTYLPIVKSLERLSAFKLKILDKKENALICDGSLINKSYSSKEWLDYDAGVIHARLTSNTLNFFPIDDNKKNTKVTFINLPDLLKVQNGRSRAILKYYASQSKAYTDIKVNTLFKITGVDKLVGTDAKKRERMIIALKKLIESGYLIDFKYFAKKQVYRCCRADYFNEGEIDNINVSNLDYFDKYLARSKDKQTYQSWLQENPNGTGNLERHPYFIEEEDAERIRLNEKYGEDYDDDYLYNF